MATLNSVEITVLEWVAWFAIALGVVLVIRRMINSFADFKEPPRETRSPRGSRPVFLPPPPSRPARNRYGSMTLPLDHENNRMPCVASDGVSVESFNSPEQALQFAERASFHNGVGPWRPRYDIPWSDHDDLVRSEADFKDRSASPNACDYCGGLLGDLRKCPDCGAKRTKGK